MLKDGKVYLTDRAIFDLSDIEAYSIESWGKTVAKRYLLKFEKAFNLIKTNPDLLLPNSDLRQSLLFYRVEKHLVVGVKIERGIAVLTVAHGSRDLPPLLQELTPTLRQETSFLLDRIDKRS